MRCISSLVPRRTRQGFTAVELAMVATVIAIIALLILPIYRKRTDEARLVAAEDELASLAKSIMLCEADTGIQPRLNDLDNGQAVRIPGNPIDVPNDPPIATWNGTLEVTIPINRDTIVENWEGPYAAYKRFLSFEEIAQKSPFYRSDLGGPIYYVTAANAYTTGETDVRAPGEEPDRYPHDPWGQPYIFFGIGISPTDPDQESTFNSNIIYSLGPNGGPGTLNTIPNATVLHRSTGILGTGDDLEYRF